MNKIQEVFRRPRVLLPVIHACSSEQVEDQADLALCYGADGIWVINQGGLDHYQVVVTAARVADHYPDAWIGVNLLGLTPLQVLNTVADCPKIKGIWSDDADARNWALRGIVQPLPHLYFGGVAFKGQLGVPADRYGEAAAEAARHGVDVVTTSGAQTGTPPNVPKIRAMRAALGDLPLALASGVSAQNVLSFLPYVDAFIVASSLERRLGDLDRERVRELAQLIHGYQPAVTPA